MLALRNLAARTTDRSGGSSREFSRSNFERFLFLFFLFFLLLSRRLRFGYVAPSSRACWTNFVDRSFHFIWILTVCFNWISTAPSASSSYFFFFKSLLIEMAVVRLDLGAFLGSLAESVRCIWQRRATFWQQRAIRPTPFSAKKNKTNKQTKNQRNKR